MEIKDLKALSLNQQQQEQLANLLPEIIKISEELGKLNYCEKQADKYKESDFDSSKVVNSEVVNIIKKIPNKQLRIYVWLATCFIAAALNMQAAEEIIPSNLEPLGPSLIDLSIVAALFVSVFFIFFIDRLIASLLNVNLRQGDINSERNNIDKEREDNKGILSQYKIYGAEQAFEIIQAKNFQDKRYFDSDKFLSGSKLSKSIAKVSNLIIPIVSTTIILVYFSGQFVLASQQAVERALSEDWTVFAIPVFGALLNFMTGWFNGIAILYPEKRNELSQEYKKQYQKDYQDSFDFNIDEMNYFTDIFLSNPYIDYELFRAQFVNRGSRRKFYDLRKQCQDRITDYKIGEKTPEDIYKVTNTIDHYKTQLNRIKEEIEAVDFSTEEITRYIEFLEQFEQDCQQEFISLEEGDLTNNIQAIYDNFTSSKKEREETTGAIFSKLNKAREENRITNDFELDLQKNNENIKLKKYMLFLLDDSIPKIKKLASDSNSENTKLIASNFIEILEDDKQDHTTKLRELENKTDDLRRKSRVQDCYDEYHHVYDEYRSIINEIDDTYQQDEQDLNQRFRPVGQPRINANQRLNKEILKLKKNLLDRKVIIIDNYLNNLVKIKGKLTRLDQSISIDEIQKSIGKLSEDLEDVRSQLRSLS